MNKDKLATVEELLKIFEDNMTEAELLSSYLLGKISSAIIQARIDMGMTQKEFAKFLGFSQGRVSKMESGECNYSIEALSNLAVKLKFNFDIVFNKSIKPICYHKATVDISNDNIRAESLSAFEKDKDSLNNNIFNDKNTSKNIGINALRSTNTYSIYGDNVC